MKSEITPAAFMQAAIALALDSVRAGRGGPFGAVIVKDGRIIGRGSNAVTSTNDPTAHAEIIAIRDACAALGTFHLRGCELYTSCEPCPMCLAAIHWAHLDRFYYGCTAADAHDIGFSDKTISEQFERPADARNIAAIPLLRDEALAAFVAWTSKADRVQY